MTDPSPSERRFSPSHLVVAALLAAELCAIGDVMLASRASGSPLPEPSLLGALFAAVGLYLWPALAVGVVAAWIADSALAIFGGDAFFRAKQALRDKQGDSTIAAVLLAALAVLALDAGLLFFYVRSIGFEMANKRNGALTSAMVAVVALPLLSLLGLPLYRICRRVVGLMPRPRLLFTLGALFALGIVCVALALLSVDWRIIHFGPAKAFAGFLALWLVLGWLFGRIFGAPRAARDGVLVLLFLIPGLVASLQLWRNFGAEPRARALISEETAGASFLLKRARAVFDRDGDGYAARLGGGDCDDHNADIHPGAEEVPGNNRDEDCDGQDEPLPPPVAEVKTPPAENPSPAPSAAKGAGKAKWDGNFLIITIDTLRADRIKQEVAPNLTALAARGTRFTNVYAQAPNTPRSFPSFTTSRLPSEVHFVKQSWNFSPVTGKDATLFTALAGGGFKNHGIFSHFYLETKTNLNPGFVEWNNSGAKNLHDSNSDIAAPRITQSVIDRLKQLGSDKSAHFALWTHLFDPHSTYMDHPEYPVPKGFKYLKERYDGEVSFVDKHIGLILNALKDSGLSERTAVVVFSDHGEAFGEHKLAGEQLFFHGEALYSEVLRVPLIVAVPGRPPQVIDDRVQLVDVAPTVLDLAGIAAPEGFYGRSLVPLMYGEGSKSPAPPAIAEMLPCTAWPKNERVIVDSIDGVEYALYAKFTDNLTELYNLRDDPTQQKNLASAEPAKAKELQKRLSAYLRPRR